MRRTMLRSRLFLQRLVGRDSGQIAVLGALAMMPLTLLLGTSLEFSLMSNHKNALQVAADSGTLTAANLKYADMTETQANGIILEMLTTNGLDRSKLVLDTTIDLTLNSRRVTSQITYNYDPFFKILAGNRIIPISVRSVASQTARNTEVIFIFDASGSMASNNRMSALKAAAEQAVDILLPNDTELTSSEDEFTRTRLGMVTYSDMVSAGAYFQAVTGIPETRSYHDATATPASYTLQDTCVGERYGDHAFADTPPVEGVSRTAEQAKMYNFHANADGWMNTSYAQYRRRPRRSYWRLYYTDCNHLPDPVPLTEDRNTLLAHIAALTPSGGTAGHQGIQWGWYMLSPAWTSIFGLDAAPAAYDDAETMKFIILMTDGAFNSSFYDSQQGPSDTQARTLCDSIKDQTNIEIFTVGFQAPNSGLDVLSYCASRPDMYFEADTTEELSEIYRQIASDISTVRIAE